MLSRLWGTVKNTPALATATTRQAFTPGNPGTMGTMTEWVSLPRVVMLLGAAYVYRQMTNTNGVKRVVQDVCDEKYCPPSYQVWVDRAQNTLMKDQSLGMGLGAPGMEGAMDPTVRQAAEVNSVADYNSHGEVGVGSGVGLDGPYTREGVGAVYRKVKADYYEEAVGHPGVRLVAHAVV